MTEEVAVQETEGQVLPEAPEKEEEPKEVSEPEGKQADPEPEVQPEKKPRGVAKRLQELTRQRDEWRAIAEQRNQQPEPVKEPEPLKTLADFQYDEGKYSSYLLETVTKQAREAASEVAKTSAQEAQSKQVEEKLMREFRSREAQFAKTVDDYEEVAYYAPITDDVARIIQATEEGPEIAYYLGNNPDVAESLNDLPPYLAGVEVGKIASRLAAEKKKAGKSVSSAPAPTPKLDGTEPGNQATASDPDSDKLSMKEWLKRRDKEIKSRKG